MVKKKKVNFGDAKPTRRMKRKVRRIKREAMVQIEVPAPLAFQLGMLLGSVSR